MFPTGEPVTLVQRALSPTPDEYGNDVWVDTNVVLPRCAVAPRSSSELVQSQDMVIVGLTVYLPPGTKVQPTDRMIIRGATYEVDGTAEEFYSPLTGSTGVVQVAVTRVTG